MTNCKHCNKKIIGMPWKGRDGNNYCDAHGLPESRGSVEAHKPNIGIAYFSNGGVGARK
jgi:hypothetical protein